MKIPEARPGEAVVHAACWSCGGRRYQTIPRHRIGWVHWSCDDCAVTWSAPARELPKAA